jgi:peroxiredoxin
MNRTVLISKSVSCVFCLAIVLASSLFFPCPSPGFTVGVGDTFPDFTLSNNLSPEDLEYLGIEGRDSFGLGDLPHSIAVIELLNVYCHTCRLQVPVFNALMAELMNDEVLRDKVTVLGITVGNSEQEVVDFKRDFGARYPIVADSNKSVYTELGAFGGTPQTYITVKEGGEWFVIDYHAGAVKSHERYLRKIKSVFRRELVGTDLGFRAPPFELNYGGEVLTNARFQGKRVLLYFPSGRSFPLEGDMREQGRQAEILRDIVTELGADLIVVGFLSEVLSEGARGKLAGERIYLAEDKRGEVISRYEVGQGPQVFFLNESGRIVFKGEYILLQTARKIVLGETFELKPNLAEEEIKARVSAGMEESAGKIGELVSHTLENGEQIFVGLPSEGDSESPLFAKVVSKLSVCDVCHDIHFIYILDQEGTIIDFVPIHLTKYGNTLWTSQDTKYLKSRIKGTSIFSSIPFNPKVDAVSTATMSSSLIFEGLNEGKQVFADATDYGFRASHWRSQCFANICLVKKALAEQGPEVLGDVRPGEALTGLLEACFPEGGVPECPLEGSYLLLGEDVLCSNHGMNVEGCP